MSFSIDTNIIINMNRDMPRDIRVGIWDALEALIAESRAEMIREAQEELRAS